MSIRLQPASNGGSRPYPYFIEADGKVGRQDFWKGEPERLIGFSDDAETGHIDVDVDEFLENPELGLNKYPVFADYAGAYSTSRVPIYEVGR